METVDGTRCKRRGRGGGGVAEVPPTVPTVNVKRKLVALWKPRIMLRVTYPSESMRRGGPDEPPRVSKRPCPYEGCGCQEVWFWGWYEREEGCLPIRDGDEVAEAVPLRRFCCTACHRTFSWRPWFLLYGRRYAALFYQLAFKDWSHVRRVPAPNVWYDLDVTGRRAFLRFLEHRGAELADRLKSDRHQRPIGQPQAVRPEEMWQLARRCIRALFNPKQSPLSIHLVCVALCQYRYRLDYH